MNFNHEKETICYLTVIALLGTILVFIPNQNSIRTDIKQNLYTFETDRRKILPLPLNKENTENDFIKKDFEYEVGAENLKFSDTFSKEAQELNKIIYSESQRYVNMLENDIGIKDPLTPMAISLQEKNTLDYSLLFSSPISVEYINSKGNTKYILQATYKDAQEVGGYNWMFNSENPSFKGPLQFSKSHGSNVCIKADEVGIVYAPVNSKRIDVSGDIGWKCSTTKYGDRWNISDIYNAFWGYEDYKMKSLKNKKDRLEIYSSLSNYGKLALTAVSHNVGEGVFTASNIKSMPLKNGQITYEQIYFWCKALDNKTFIENAISQLRTDKPNNKDEAYKSIKKVLNFAYEAYYGDKNFLNEIKNRIDGNSGTVKAKEIVRFPVQNIANYMMLQLRFSGEW